MARMSTHRLAQMLETLCQILRELPEESLHTLIQELRTIHEKRRQSRKSRLIRTLPPPPRDPRQMERHELEGYLQNSEYFPYKSVLLAFARHYKIPVNTRTPREEIVRMCLRIIHDIPRGFAVLRSLAEKYDEPLTSQNPSSLVH